jgi:hypothetical protein
VIPPPPPQIAGPRPHPQIPIPQHANTAERASFWQDWGDP